MYNLKKAKFNQNFPITIINAKEQKAFIGVDGKSEQNGTPSPSNPIEIHSVATDDVNIFDKEKASINSGAIKTALDNGVKITLDSSGTYKSCGIEIGGTELLGKTITLYSKITPSSNNKGAVFIYYGNSSNMAVSNAYANITSTGSLTKTLVSEFPTNCDRVYALFYGNRDGTGNIDDYVDYTDLKIQYGTEATPYSPYNQGTVEIKQSGKNKFNYAEASDTNNTNVTQYRIFEIDGLKPNTQYNINNMGFTQNLNNQYCYLWDTDTYSTSNKYLLAYVNQYNTKASFISNNEGKIYLAIYPTDTTTWESVISYLENAQIEERKQFNPLRTISNTTRLHIPNRTIT